MSNKLILNTLIFLLSTSFKGFSQELPIFTEKLQKGVYDTFEEFKFNNPSYTDSLYFESERRRSKKWTETFSVTAKYGYSNKKVKKAWGFCDGEKAYVFHELEYFEIDLSNNKFIFYGYGAYNENSATTATILGGVIVGGTVYAVSKGNAKAKRIKYHINQVDGSINEAINVAFDEVVVQPDVYIIFYRYGKKETSGKIQLTINDTLKFTLDPYSYDQFKFKVSREPVKVDYGDGETILFVDIQNEQNKYVEVSNTKANKKEKLVLWDFEKGDFFAKRAKKQQLEREQKK